MRVQVVLAIAAGAVVAGALAAVAPAVDGMNRFAVDLFGGIAGDGNRALSPFSISTVLSMALAGARGVTASEMANTLHQSLPEAALDAAMRDLMRDLRATADNQAELSIANALWVQRGATLRKQFVDTMHDNYGANTAEVDFRGNVDRARSDINRWTESKTAGRIRDLLPPGSVNADSLAVLTNAIHFKGRWQSPFAKDRTRPAPFHRPGGAAVQVLFMNQSSTFSYSETGTAQILEMQYGGSSLAMMVVLPKTQDGLPALEHSLSPQSSVQWRSGLRSRQVHVSLPRFRVESEFSLADTLARMGMKTVFTAAADLSGMNGRRDLYLSAVVHKAFVEVNEEGTEAAAATGAVIGLTAEIEEPTFVANHPFLFFIHDTRTGAALFLGRVTDPRS